MPTNGTKNRDSSVEVGLSTESKPAQINIVLDDELSIYQVSQVAPLFKNALASASADGIPVRVDMSAVMECDGAGLQLLLALSRAAHTAGLNVELIGHSDMDETAEAKLDEEVANMAQKRAISVKEALVGYGINSSRISVSFVDDSQPANTFNSPSGHAQNRRVVFKVK